MKDVVNKNICLVLDRSMRAIRVATPKEAFIKFFGEKRGDRLQPVLIEYADQIDEEGNITYDFSAPIMIQPVSAEVWMQRKPRSFDSVIRTSNREIAVPTVVIAANYSHKNIEKKAIKKVSKARIAQAYGGYCAYTHKLLKGSEKTIDHVIPKSRGGKDTLDNLVLCHKDINRRKANKTPQEAGLEFPHILTEREYNQIPIHNHYNLPDWQWFL